MKDLLAFLLRNGSGLVKDGVEMLIGQALVRIVTERLKGILLFYAGITVFALAALIFFYVLIYRLLAMRLDDTSAAAILLGANLVLIGLMFAGKAMFRRKPAVTASPLVEMLKLRAEHIGVAVKDEHFEAGLALGTEFGHRLRKATPQIALAAAVLGLVIGIRPQILGLFSRRDPPPRNPDRKKR
jgi:4-amino-4-deoxy-L-arabinose transferase-like glycosyltransferase